jgi:hypothetical protein
MGSQVRQLLVILCVTLSLALFTLGDADLTDGFYLRTLRYSRPMTIMGPVLDIIIVSRVIVDTSCEELGWYVNMSLLRLVRVHRFASSIVTPQGYKASDRPCTHLHPLTQTPVTSSPPSLCLKRQKDRERNIET